MILKECDFDQDGRLDINDFFRVMNFDKKGGDSG